MKASVLLFYRRIFRGKTFGIVYTGCLTLVAMWTAAFLFDILFTCVFLPGFNDTPLRIQKCRGIDIVQVSLCYIDLITDFFVLCIPAPMVWRLQMPRGRKLAVIGMFMFGAVALAASSLRLVSFYEEDWDNFFKPQDMLLTSLVYWTEVELGISIAAACLPTLRPVFADTSLRTVVFRLRSLFVPRSNGESNENVRAPQDHELVSVLGHEPQSKPF